MKNIKVKFNDLHSMMIDSPGCYGVVARGDIINVDKDEYDNKLKYKKNLNGEPIYIPVTKKSESESEQVEKNE